MVKYPDDNFMNVQAPSVTGAVVSDSLFVDGSGVIPWQPKTWPPAPDTFDGTFLALLRRIFQESMLDELRNVVRDIQAANPGLNPIAHRGHVISVAYLCALDAMSSYGYKNRHVKKFVRAHFPEEYKAYAGRIYPDYRHNLVHAWNLFGNAALLSGNEPITEKNGIVCFGLLNFAEAFEKGVADFLEKLETDRQLQERTLHRYREVTGEIQPSKPNRIPVAGIVGFVLGIGSALMIEAFRR